MKAECKKLIDFIQLNQKNKLEINMNQFPDRLLKSFKEYEAEFIKQIKQISAIPAKSFINIDNILQKQYSIMSMNDDQCFSQLFKGDSILIVDKVVATQTIKKNFEDCFVFVEPSLRNVLPQKFGFQIKNASQWIGIGICYKGILLKNNLKFEHDCIGHGTYMMSSNGFSWNSTNKSENKID